MKRRIEIVLGGPEEAERTAETRIRLMDNEYVAIDQDEGETSVWVHKDDITEFCRELLALRESLPL